jgi:hypothetical protein
MTTFPRSLPQSNTNRKCRMSLVTTSTLRSTAGQRPGPVHPRRRLNLSWNAQIVTKQPILPRREGCQKFLPGNDLCQEKCIFQQFRWKISSDIFHGIILYSDLFLYHKVPMDFWRAYLLSTSLLDNHVGYSVKKAVREPFPQRNRLGCDLKRPQRYGDCITQNGPGGVISRRNRCRDNDGIRSGAS